MTKRERLQAAIRGQPTDRPPWSLWRHFYEAESTAEQLVGRMLSWVRTYEFDFLKVNPRAQYHVEGWGARYQYSGRQHDRPQLLDWPIKTVEDWERLEVLDLDSPALAEQLAGVRAIGEGLSGEVPFAETVFSPLAVAGYLVQDNQTLVRHLREHPSAVHQALDTITRTFAPFANACLAAGADGIFFATTRWASRDYLTYEEYAEFGRPYDLRVLEAVRGADFNILHVCDSHNMLLDPSAGSEPALSAAKGRGLADYPVQAFNWAATDPTNPNLAAAAALPGLRIGGVSGDALTRPDTAQVIREVDAAREQAGPARWALGPNCSIPTTSRDENIRAAGRAIGVEV
jgi:uroporphyrinogen decarboxylase